MAFSYICLTKSYIFVRFGPADTGMIRSALYSGCPVPAMLRSHHRRTYGPRCFRSGWERRPAGAAHWPAMLPPGQSWCTCRRRAGRPRHRSPHGPPACRRCLPPHTRGSRPTPLRSPPSCWPGGGTACPHCTRQRHQRQCP